MFKVQIFCLILITFSLFTYSQEKTQSQDIENLRKESLKLYQEKKYGDALSVSRQVLQIVEEKFGNQHLEYAKALGNIAIIEIASGDIARGESTMSDAVLIFEKQTDLIIDDGISLAGLYDVLGYAKYQNGKLNEAIKSYQRALQLKERYSGIKTQETSRTLWQLGNMSIVAGDKQGAFQYFERVLRIRLENFQDNSADEVSDAVERYDCASIKANKIKESKELIAEARKKVSLITKQAIIDGGIVNGKAIYLAKPGYPYAARAEGVAGSVKVQVTIDKTGKVIFACAKTGHVLLHSNAEQAALSSKFKPTLINNIPVKITGIIVYNFQ